MSAFLCSPKHIGQLAGWYPAGNPDIDGEQDDKCEAAVKLGRANMKSIMARYGQDDDSINSVCEEWSGLNYTDYLASCSMYARYGNKNSTLESVDILKMAQCFAYQACEFDGWKDDDAYRVLDWIKGEAIRKLEGYDDAPWDYDEIKEVA